MSKKALVIGYGSIGRRHAELLTSMDNISKVYVLSSQENLPYHTITILEETKNINPDYMVIASSTSLHFDQLYYLENNFSGKTIMVEKPLFDTCHNLTIKNNSVFVAYNLRFHPIINLIKSKIIDRKLWNIQVFCGSYLPEWRPGRDYRKTSSAKKTLGGGVLLDLSHELDYVQWIAGSIVPKYVCNEKVSELEIETEDLLLMSGKTKRGANVHISLNYFTREAIRQVIIDGEGISINADLIANTATVHMDDESSSYSFPEYERNTTYRAEHEALISGNTVNACTYDEGIETMSLINSIRKWRS